MPLNLDYFYGNEAEQYSFYRIPKALFMDKRYKGICVEAKVLYGLMLDRMSLSLRNGWLSSEGRVYIYFTMEDAMAQISCGHNKAVKLFADLSAIGLIERVKQGQGRPARIFVKNFVLPLEPEPAPEPEPPQVPESPKNPELPSEPSPPINGQTSEKRKPEPPDMEKPLTSDNRKPAFPDIPEGLISDKGKSAPPIAGSLDCTKAEANKTNKNHTEGSETDLSTLPPAPVPRGKSDSACQREQRRRMRMDERDAYRTLIELNIDYPDLLRMYPYDAEILDGYVELMVDACCTRREFIRVDQEDKPAEVVKSHFLKLTGEHISYVLDCMRDNPTKIGNIKAYTLTALYNAPMLMSQYYTSRASHDMAQGQLAD
ncbi:replication initiator A domain-containing protein [Butyricicoccus sp. 1XD8-22]|nr:replication initiator A domain-containing protein [Butyricicoccus sp. 1XD8-22]